jgi:hypothetical protein
VWADREREPTDMSSAARRWPFEIRRCTRCTREAVVVVTGDRRSGAVAACTEHLEWAFFLDIDEWSGRRRTA